MASLVDGHAVSILYVNYRGEEAIRHVIPYENGLRFGANEWHKEPQYLLRVYDLDKREDREFAMSGVKMWDIKGEPDVAKKQ